jgi:hypothetical protein
MTENQMRRVVEQVNTIQIALRDNIKPKSEPSTAYEPVPVLDGALREVASGQSK